MTQLASVWARAQNGLEADPVTVEVHLAPGLPGLNIVGLPEAAVREAKDRVKAAITTCGYRFPLQRITCNLAPADLPKSGSRFDLAIALGILGASGQIPLETLHDVEVLGELSLSGEIRPVPGCLPAALKARAAGHALLVPSANVAEATLAPQARIYGADNLAALCANLHQRHWTAEPAQSPRAAFNNLLDLADVRGQGSARRALEVAAAGGHSLLLAGPPGSGKSMLAQRLPGILPALSDTEALEAAAVASIGPRGFQISDWGRRPFRAPHHTASGVALVGGGGNPRPGEITLAHHGVLFLDELPEFDRRVLEVLREPLESGRITISRAARQVDFPARFQLVAAMNPCPCGWLGDPSGKCRCTPEQVQRYRGRISGPLLDRIDLHLFVHRVEHLALAREQAPGEPSEAVRSRVIFARRRQLDRQQQLNSELHGSQLDRYCRPDRDAEVLLQQAAARLSLSARGYHRILRVARTIADLHDTADIGAPQIAEALRYRGFDRSA
ncbi:ATP-dependent protease [Sinimarinibacterium sp. CAU 1509]|uniref:YifB family Mg chelatase-like AAA ATPase n=1 Tax=Sinimarinibacterium sp. CAU 1509 TaxID=2562283 RepID=UPI0010AD3A0C|nr:YifB family Mg chelatase-like AAA ATPase [Sinimarinibacterium sp. CAU 1509]TJY58363.1 ATP-dependent protease [Sinimarinibacterium sp. CAU 1509]